MRGRMQAYRERRSREELRADVFPIWIAGPACAVALLFQAWTLLPARTGWVCVAGAVALLGLGVALWRCAPWSRFAAAAVLGFLAVGGAVSFMRGESSAAWWSLLRALVWGSIALYLAHPATGARFRAMRSGAR